MRTNITLYNIYPELEYQIGEIHVVLSQKVLVC